MDEKPDESRQLHDHERNDADITFPRGTEETQTPGGPPGRGGWTFVSQAHYDPDEQRDLTTVIISAIADAEEVAITEITSPPLYDAVDIAGIDDALFGRPSANKGGTSSAVEFRYNQYKVTVEADGWVTVSQRGEKSADGADSQ